MPVAADVRRRIVSRPRSPLASTIGKAGKISSVVRPQATNRMLAVSRNFVVGVMA
jgi:hypothetical protein